MTIATLEQSKVVSPADWLAARKKLLAREKEYTHLRDALAVERQALPWVRVEKNYTFDTPAGRKSLADLFDGHSQLAVYHFMFGADWPEGCPSCSMIGDGIDGVLPHLLQRDVSFTAVSRAPLAKLQAFQQRMGWRFPWASAHDTTFNQDFRVSFTKEELASGKPYNFGTVGFPAEEAPGFSAFAKDPSGNVYHTYSTYGRGLEETARRLLLPRSRAQGPRRSQHETPSHGLGPPSRQISSAGLRQVRAFRPCRRSRRETRVLPRRKALTSATL